MIEIFKAKEAERKMREAALRHDFEAAIPFRGEWRRLTAELAEIDRLAEQDAKDRKVIDWKTRKPVEPEPDRSDYTVIDLVGVADEQDEDDAPFVPLEEEIALLGHITDEVKKGALSGLIIFAGHRENNGDIDLVSSWSSTVAWDEMQKFLGSIEECKHDLLAVSADAYDEISDDEV